MTATLSEFWKKKPLSISAITCSSSYPRKCHLTYIDRASAGESPATLALSSAWHGAGSWLNGFDMRELGGEPAGYIIGHRQRRERGVRSSWGFRA